MTKARTTSSPEAGTGKASVIFTTRSGVPSCQPLGKDGGGGAFAGSPRGAPASIHALSSAISASASRRSSRNSPQPGAGFQGGMKRDSVTRTICRTRLAASS